MKILNRFTGELLLDYPGDNLSRADLSGADLSWANLSGANLSGANLSRADLSGANLSGANLSRADLSEAQGAGLALAKASFIPQEGAFVGWKKCRNGVIVKLLIPESAKRSHGAGRKCRASEVMVLDVIGAETGMSFYKASVIYKKGETIRPENGWGENRWQECAPGIHFFLTREEAEAYN